MIPIDCPPIEGGVVTVERGMISAVGDARSVSGAAEDLGDVVLLPGLVNAHTHLEFSDLGSPLGTSSMSLPAWIRLVIAERGRGRRDPAAAIAAGRRESLAAGVTSVGEICTAPASAYDSDDATARVVAFQESIGFSSQRVESAFADVAQRFDHAPRPRGLSPHAPYTAHPRLVERIAAHSAGCGVPVAMHLAESREELELLADGTGGFRELLQDRGMWDDSAIPRGSRPLDYLQRLATASLAVVIHGNYLDREEIEFLAERRDRMAVAYCPRTHAYFEHATYPLEAMLKAKARVALGTDSRASNPDLDLLAELRFAAARHPQVPPATWVRMATADAAIAIGLSLDTGTLTPGKRADLVALPCGAGDPYEAIVGGDAAISRVWLSGRELTTPASS